MRISFCVPYWCCLALLVSSYYSVVEAAVGGEIAAFDNAPYLVGRGVENPLYHNTRRQNLCERYQQVHEGKIALRNALRGLELRPLVLADSDGFFLYSNETGIDTGNKGGLMAILLDELGRRAGFTWRTSFGVNFLPPPGNMTFTDILLWSVEDYDISISWWDQTLERLEGGASFTRPFFDGSLILIEKRAPHDTGKDAVNLFNWLRPFMPTVWCVTLATIIVSALTYQWIEHLAGERDDRSLFQWFSDNLYFSAINFPQIYEFQPTTTAGRIFGVSMTWWALVMAASYTANLASLLVERKTFPSSVESIDDVVKRGLPVCTYANTGADQHIRQKYGSAVRVPLQTELETYEGLNEGQCDFAVGYYQNWMGHQRERAYNPDCDLEWVGRTIKTIQSGFAVKADVGIKCTSLIREVFNIYLDELITNDYIEDLWEAEYMKTQDINCDAGTNLASSRRGLRLAREENQESLRTQGPLQDASNRARRKRQLQARRKLKESVGRGEAASGGDGTEEEEDGEDQRLTLNQMGGIFVVHYLLSILAIMTAYLGRWMHEPSRPLVNKKTLATVSRSMLKSSKALTGSRRTVGDPEPASGGSISLDGGVVREYLTPPASERYLCESHHHDLLSEPAAASQEAAWERELRTTRLELQQTCEGLSEQMNMILTLMGDTPGKASRM